MPDVRPITQNFARPSYRPQENAGLDPDMKRMILTAGGVGAGLAVLIGLFSYGGAMRHHGVPVIAAPETPVRIKPANPGGMQVAGADDLTPSSGETLAPAAEKPAIRALHAKRLERVTHETVEAPVTLHDPAVVAPPAVATVTPASPAVAKAAAAPERAPGLAGSAAIQLAAFESRAEAEADWGKLAEKMPALFNGHRPEVVPARLANRTVYRLRTGGFPNTDAARSFCAEVRSRGEDCSISTF